MDGADLLVDHHDNNLGIQIRLIQGVPRLLKIQGVGVQGEILTLELNMEKYS